MAWTSKFSGLPTSTDIPFIFPLDTYLGGVFTVQAGARDFPSGRAPIAYESLAGIGASILSVLRVTARLTDILGTYYALGGGPVLYGPDRTDQLYGQIKGSGFWEAAAVENNIWASIGGVSDPGATVWQIRFYWNGTGAGFTIPDAGFGSHVVASTTQSVWYSKDDGTTWSHLGDRAIAGGVAPTRVGFGAINTNSFDITPRTVTFSGLEVMEEAPSFASHDKTLLSEGSIWINKNPSSPGSSFSFGVTDSPPRTTYDPFRGKMLMVGYDTTHRFFDYDPSTNLWTVITLAGIAGINFPAMNGDALKIAFDSQRRRILVFVSSPAALWSWDPAAGWSKLVLTGDSIESMRGYDSQIVYDPFRLALWVVGRPFAGGSDPLIYLIDTTTLVVSDLSPTVGTPGTDYPDFTDRQGFGAAYDPVSRALLISHGGNTTIPTLYADTWAFDGMWANVTPGGIEGANYPEARSLCLMAVGVDDQLVHLVGGVSDAETFGDEWIWDGMYWSKRAVSGSGVAYLGFNMGGTGHAR